jgi:predicted nuclease of predicted toxin-antitoxin system
MKFIIDAQLPYLLATWIREKGFEAIHTDDLPDKDETEDDVIRDLADKSDYVVISKDSDFYDSHLIKKTPKKLLLIGTGNIKNRQLLDLFRKNFQEIIILFSFCEMVEMNNDDLIAYE